jgi:hypothetical protein
MLERQDDRGTSTIRTIEGKRGIVLSKQRHSIVEENELTVVAPSQRLPSPFVSSGLVDVALRIAEERSELLGGLRSALEQGENEDALAIARQLCGLE